MIKTIFALLLLVMPAAAQFTNAKSIWSKGIDNSTLADGYVLKYSSSAGKYIWVSQARSIGMLFDGGGVALANNQVKYFTWLGPPCTITKWAVTVDTGTITFDVWKIATGTAIPTVTNTIVASAPPILSANTAANSSTLTGWTTAVTTGDIFAFKVTAISSATQSSVVLSCVP